MEKVFHHEGTTDTKKEFIAQRRKGREGKSIVISTRGRNLS